MRLRRRWLVALVLFAFTPGARGNDSDITVAPPERPITAKEKQHWSYLPLAKSSPPIVDPDGWNRNPIDPFIRSTLEGKGLAPMPLVGKATLLRRVYFDLTGLPPKPEEVLAFLKDTRADAFEQVVDRLLDSPHYGERWGQHWLDLARFAETDGFEHDLVRPNAWRYRDWVIDAIHNDLPFDEFLRRQIAGDELYPGDPSASIATGFLLCGPDMPDLNLQEERRHLVLNEMTSTVGSVFLGLQFGCAQCHDHKYDALTQYDFYRLRAFFESVEIFRDHPIPTAEDLEIRRKAESARPPDFVAKEKRRRELEDLGRERFREKNPDVQPSRAQWMAELTNKERQEHASIQEELASAPPLPELPMGRVVRAGKPRRGHLFLRGDFRAEGPALDCGFPRCLTGKDSTFDPSVTPRATLVAWLTSGKQPLVARVIVNRLWKWHFGKGLAAATSDFGVMGYEPTHPELLDWLARHFIESGWSMKKLHRLLVTSETYRLASAPFDLEWDDATLAAARIIWSKGESEDPENSLLWRRDRQRLEGEAIRDSMLAVSGRLSEKRGGPGVRPPLPPEVTLTLLKGQWPVTEQEEEHRRRSIYLFVRRNLRYPLFDVFDRPDTNASCPERHVSTTATQSLILFNSQLTFDCAQSLAKVLLQEAVGEDPVANQIQDAYLRVFHRLPTSEEVDTSRRFLQEQVQLPSATEESAWTQFCVALFNASEFVFVD
ncbi:MAG: DUF1549 and DUF1553 domain-containing protein [Planctomycetota bacterium]